MTKYLIVLNVLSLKAVKGAILMDGDDYWKNYFGTKEENWGGSDTPGTVRFFFKNKLFSDLSP